VKLEIRREGSGPRSAALVHGAGAAGDAWRDFARILVDRHDLTVLTLDLRGHGSSPRADSYRFDDFAADLVETLPTGLDFLVGQSLGGRVTALASAALAPGRYIGLDPAFSLPASNGLIMRLAAPLQPILPTWLINALVHLPDTAAHDTIERMQGWWSQWDRSMIAELTRSASHPEFLPQPPAVPSTIVLAEPSVVVPPQRAEAFRALGWDVRVKPGANHDMHLQDPAGLAAFLDDVLVAP
jgi:pimeloyl-ACP methyl ester carboxylesterase